MFGEPWPETLKCHEMSRRVGAQPQTAQSKQRSGVGLRLQMLQVSHASHVLVAARWFEAGRSSLCPSHGLLTGPGQ